MWTKIDPEAFERLVKDIPESEIDRTELGYTYYMVEGMEAFYSVKRDSGMTYFRFHDDNDTFNDEAFFNDEWEGSC